MLPLSSSANLCRQFSLSDIKSATNNFSDDLVIGKGAFGDVYRGEINNVTVAIKRLNRASKQGPPEFWNEVNLLSTLRHSNLISLIGYCVDHDENEMILVYEHMPNGTLADHIYIRNQNCSYLSWEQRLSILIGVGRGLEYLHTGTGIDQKVIHRDFKSSNILLDQNLAAKISDFGFCKTCYANPQYSPITASVKGTFAYMDPAYCSTHRLSRKTDVYAFGVVLLEVLCGRRALDFEVEERQKRLVSWAQLCIREEVVFRVMDPGLRGRISDTGLRIFSDVTLKCLQDRPEKRPTMTEVVAKLESALASQFTTYSSSSSTDDEFVKILFAHEACSSSCASSDVDPQDPGTESMTSTFGKRFTRVKSFFRNEAFHVPSELQSSRVHADVSMGNITHATSKTSINLSHDKDGAYQKLVRRMNQSRVVIDNEYLKNATVIKVDGPNRQELLLNIVQVLTQFDLIVAKASITSDGGWFIDVFNVVDQEGKKITDEATLDNIHEALRVYTSITTDDERSFPNCHTTIELIGNDRLGLLSEVSAVLADLKCDVMAAEMWTHNSRMAAVMQVSDEETGDAISDDERLSKIKKYLSSVLMGGTDHGEAKINFAFGYTSFDRRLHQMMFADRDYERGNIKALNEELIQDLRVWYDKDYSVISIRCKNKPKLLFDTICTLTDLQYYVFHGNIRAIGPEAYMEFWTQHIDGLPIGRGAEKEWVIQCLEAAIERRVSEGLKIELRTTDRVGLLSDVTRIIRENGLIITRAVVTSKNRKAIETFYVADVFGNPADLKILDTIRDEIGQRVLQVKGIHERLYQVPQQSITRSVFSEFFKSIVGPPWVVSL